LVSEADSKSELLNLEEAI